MATCRVIILCIALAAVNALPAEEARGSRNAIQTENDLLDNIYTDCQRKDSVSCLKYKLFSFVDKMLGHRDSITVVDGVQIVKTSDEKQGAPRAFSGDETIESLIIGRVQSFLESHTIKVDLKGSDVVNAVSSSARSLSDMYDTYSKEAENEVGVEESRGKKKKAAKIIGPLLAAAAVKIGVLCKVALGGIALIAGKALLVGKIALVLSAIIGLKKLLSQQKHVTYEVVSHPHHSSSSHVSHDVGGYGGSGGGGGYAGDIGGGGYSAGGASSGHGGWGRSLEAQQIAYNAHAQKSTAQ